MIELASVVSDLRDELQRAIATGEGSDLRFELGPIELEMAVAVERTVDAGGKVRFWVVEIDGERKKGTTDTQRIKLTLTPRLGNETRPAFVSGQAAPGEEG